MFTPIPLNLPPYPLQLSTDGKKHYIFDELRKKHLVWTPEEWVRQHWIHYLIHEKKYPKTLIKSESGLVLNGMPRRSDLIIFNNKGERILLAEFKRPSVALTQSVIDQVSRYNLVYKIPLLMVSNGLQHIYWTVDAETREYKFLAELPIYSA